MSISPICRWQCRFDSVKQYEDYIARLHQIPRVFTQTEEVLRAGMKDHLMPVRFLLEKVPEQCQGVIAADPFLLPTKKFPAAISRADQQRLTQADHRHRHERGTAGLPGFCQLHCHASTRRTAAPRCRSLRCPVANSAI